MSAKTALVLGATGMVGMPLAMALVEDGWRVFGAARMSRPAKKKLLDDAGIETMKFEVTSDDPAVLPDVDVLFLRSWDPSRPELIWPINFYGVGRVVERYAGAADVVNGCTINVYGEGAEPFTEQMPCTPSAEYGRSRVAQENLINYFCFRSGSKGVHVRYAHSNTAKQGQIRKFAETILAGKSLGPNPAQKIQLIALEDFVNVTIKSLEHMACPPATINCCHPRVWTFRELAAEIHQQLGKGSVIFDRESGGVEASCHADASRMIRLIGEPTVPVEKLIERVVEDLLK